MPRRPSPRGSRPDPRLPRHGRDRGVRASGALLAAAKKQTLVTFLFFAVVTGIGGGTVRDLLIGAPVFWVHENWTLLICFGAALAVWLLPARLWKGRALLWFDAAGLAAFSAYGAAKGLAFDLAPIPAIAMGVLTGCLGGIIRDVLAGEPSILMRPRALRHRRRFVGGLARRPEPGGRAGRHRRPRSPSPPASPCAAPRSGAAGRCPPTRASPSRPPRPAWAPPGGSRAAPAAAARGRRCAIRGT